jgi:hypothetical protein
MAVCSSPRRRSNQEKEEGQIMPRRPRELPDINDVVDEERNSFHAALTPLGRKPNALREHIQNVQGLIARKAQVDPARLNELVTALQVTSAKLNNIAAELAPPEPTLINPED